MIEHWSNTLLSVEEMRPPCCSVDVSNGSSAQLQDDIHIPEVYVQDKHALMQTRFGHSRQTEAAPSCSIVSCKETWSHLHFQALLFFFFTFWEVKDCVQWYKTSLSLLKGLGSAAGSSHSSPSVILPSSSMAEMGHQLQLVGVTWLEDAMTERFVRVEERSEEGEDGERVCVKGKESEQANKRERERKLSGSSAAASPVHAAAATASISLGQLRASQGKNTHTLIHMQIPTYSSMPLYLQLNRWVTILHHMMRYAQTCAVETPRRERFSGRSIGSCKDNGGCGPRYARKFSLCGA